MMVHSMAGGGPQKNDVYLTLGVGSTFVFVIVLVAVLFGGT